MSQVIQSIAAGATLMGRIGSDENVGHNNLFFLFRCNESKEKADSGVPSTLGASAAVLIIMAFAFTWNV